jgi:hypothetical protein
MNTHPDGRDDLQDPQLAQWYRESGGPEPSAALDQTILAAAHREVHARPRSAGAVLRRWRVPLSLAAVVLLSVTMVTLVTEHGGELADMGAPPRPEERAPQLPGATRMQPQVEGAPAASAERARAAPDALAKHRSDEFVPAPAAPSAAAPAPVAPVQPGQGKQAPPLRDALRERAAAGRPSLEAIPGPTEAQTSAAGSLAAGASGAVGSTPDSEVGRREDARSAASARDDSAPTAASAAKKAQALEQGPAAPGAAAPTVAPRRASPPAARPFGSQAQDSAVAEQRPLTRSQAAAKPMPPGGEVAQLLKALENQPPERWLEKIEELRRAGRNAEGDEVLAAFRKRFPEHPGAAIR